MQATTTTQPKVDRVTVAMVRDAYERTGYMPIQYDFFDFTVPGRKGCCPAAAVAFDRGMVVLGEVSTGKQIRETLDLDSAYLAGFHSGVEVDDESDIAEAVSRFRNQQDRFRLGLEDGRAVAADLFDEATSVST